MPELCGLHPLTKLGEMFNVTGNAVKKWCDSYNIARPPQGYWLKKANTSEAES